MENTITFLLDGKLCTIDFNSDAPYTPTTTVLQYLRRDPGHQGTKEGCAEGDCGACTVVLAEPVGDKLQYQAMNSCLMFLPRLHGCQLITVENISAPREALHPVQQALVDHHASQCGYCTPGFTMSLFDHYKNNRGPQRAAIEDTLSGNLCRCTGYQPILDAAQDVLARPQADRFSETEKVVQKSLAQIDRKSRHLHTAEQDYFLPFTLEEALKIKKKYPQILVINGSSDVALRVTKKHEMLPAILDLSKIHALQQIKITANHWRIGSGATLNMILQHAAGAFPALYKACKTFGSHQIRNAATIGGNLAGASPIADLTPLLMACDAHVVLQSTTGRRDLSLEEFITGYRQTALRDDEILTEVELDLPDRKWQVDFYKISKRYDLDIATVSAGFALLPDADGLIEDCRLVFGGMAESTRRATEAEKFLIGKEWQMTIAEQAADLVRESFNPISDARSGAAFRSLAAGNLLLKFCSQFQGDSVKAGVL